MKYNAIDVYFKYYCLCNKFKYACLYINLNLLMHACARARVQCMVGRAIVSNCALIIKY